MSNNPAPGYATHPDHTVAIGLPDRRARVTHKDILLADTQVARAVDETGYEQVLYIPRDDVAMDQLVSFVHRTHCPFKGDAAYWTTSAGGASGPVAWSYDAPFDEALAIAGYIAFYADRVEIETD